MKARRYDRETDFSHIKAWGDEWGAEYIKEQFPTVGYIVDGVAAYFLYCTDSSVCWLENLISKRGIDEKTRENALNMIFDAILEEARELGYKIAYATTDNVAVAKRAKEHGAFLKVNQILLTKDLTTRTQ